MGRDGIFGDLCLCIGAVHAGTGWMRRVLAGHPGLWVCPVDVGYFAHRHGAAPPLDRATRAARLQEAALHPSAAGSTPEADWAARYLQDPVDDDWYRGLLDTQGTGASTCDLSDDYALLSAADWHRIEAQCTSLRVIYMMRDPLARLWHHGTAQGTGSTCADFMGQGAIRAAGDYGRTLAAMQDGLSAGSWRVLFQEDLMDDPRFTLRGIERFLDLLPAPYPAVPVLADTGPPAPEPDGIPADVAATLAGVRRAVEAAGFSPPDCWVL